MASRYRLSDLTQDPVYNMELGMTELSRQLSDWGGSYVLATAAYNAGPGNVRKWIAMYGDPRDARVDPVDWIEEIPFSKRAIMCSACWKISRFIGTG